MLTIKLRTNTTTEVRSTDNVVNHVKAARILFSYQTPVAVMMESNKRPTVIYKTKTKFSATTGAHINEWIAEYEKWDFIEIEEISQADIEWHARAAGVQSLVISSGHIAAKRLKTNKKIKEVSNGEQ